MQKFYQGLSENMGEAKAQSMSPQSQCSTCPPSPWVFSQGSSRKRVLTSLLSLSKHPISSHTGIALDPSHEMTHEFSSILHLSMAWH